MGELHAPQAPASSRHSNVEPVSVDVNEKLADGDVTVPDGPELIVVSGGVVSGGGGTSTVQVREAGDASVLPARVGGAHVERVRAVREARVAPWASCTSPTRRRRAGTRTSSRSRSTMNARLAESEATVPDGPESIVVSGGVVSDGGTTTSTIQVWDAGVASVLPAPSVARTSKVWSAFARFEYDLGELHEPQDAGVEPALERRAGLARSEREARGRTTRPRWAGPS